MNKFRVVVWQTTSKNASKSVQHDYFFLIQPIMFICDAIVAVAVVVS